MCQVGREVEEDDDDDVQFPCIYKTKELSSNLEWRDGRCGSERRTDLVDLEQQVYHQLCLGGVMFDLWDTLPM